MNSHVIDTDRLQLNVWTADAYAQLFETSDKEEIIHTLGITSEEEYLKELGRYQGGLKMYNRSLLYFQIKLKSNQLTIGGIGYHNWLPDHKKAEIGYAIKFDEYKNQGFMKEAMLPVLKHGFIDMNLHRIEACISPLNTPSLKLVEHFGFVREGLLKENYYTNGKFEDSLIFSLLKPNATHL